MSWQNSAEWANFCLSINVSFYSFSIKWELKLWNKNPGLIILALCDSGLKVLLCVSCFARFWRIRSEFLNCDLTSDVPFKSTRGHNTHIELYLLLGLFACLSFRFRALRSRVCVCSRRVAEDRSFSLVSGWPGSSLVLWFAPSASWRHSYQNYLI